MRPLHHLFAIVLLLSLSGLADRAHGSGRLGVFEVLGVNGKRVGTAWLLDDEQGLMLTAAHVAWEGGAGGPGSALKVRASRFANVLVPPRLIRITVDVDVVCWGGPDDDARDWAEAVAAEPSSDDWALLRVQSTTDRRVATLLTFFEPIPVDSFVTSTVLAQRADAASPGAFTAYGYPAENSEPRPASGDLRQRHAPPDLWSLSVPVRGGNSGGPVVGPASAASSPRVAYGMMIHKDASNSDYSVVIAVHSILDDIAAKAPSGPRLTRITSAFMTDDPRRDDSAWFRAIAAIGGLRFFEHRQLVEWVCREPRLEKLWEFLRAYYRQYPGARFLERLMECSTDVAAAVTEHVSALADRSGGPGPRPDALDAHLARMAAGHVMARASVEGILADEQRRQAAALLLSSAYVLSAAEPASPEALDFRRRAVLVGLQLDPEIPPQEQFAALALVAEPHSRDARFTLAALVGDATRTEHGGHHFVQFSAGGRAGYVLDQLLPESVERAPNDVYSAGIDDAAILTQIDFEELGRIDAATVEALRAMVVRDLGSGRAPDATSEPMWAWPGPALRKDPFRGTGPG